MPCALDSVASLTKMKHLNKIKQNVEKKNNKKTATKHYNYNYKLKLNYMIKLYVQISKIYLQ